MSTSNIYLQTYTQTVTALSSNSHLNLETNSIITPPEHVTKKEAYGSMPQQRITQAIETLLTKYTHIVLMDFVYM